MEYPKLHFDGQIWRPPYEANSQLLQVTSGCTWSKLWYTFPHVPNF